MKQIELSIAKFRILLNDIELISYDIEQLKQNDSKDRSTTSSSINRRWKDLLEQTTDEYHRLEDQFERMKSKHKFIDRIEHELDSIDRQVHGSTINTKFSALIERLEQIEGQINDELVRSDDQQIHGLKGKPLHRFSPSLLSSPGRPIDRRQASNRDQRRRTGRISAVHSTVSQISGQIHRVADRERTSPEQPKVDSTPVRSLSNAAQTGGRAKGVPSPIGRVQGALHRFEQISDTPSIRLA